MSACKTRKASRWTASTSTSDRLSGGSVVKNPPAKQETLVRSLSCQDPLEKEMATYSSILAWKISWTQEPGGLQSMGSQRVGHDWATNTYKHVKKKKKSEKAPPNFTREVSVIIDMVYDQCLLENLIHILSQSLGIFESFERCSLKHLNFYYPINISWIHWCARYCTEEKQGITWAPN